MKSLPKITINKINLSEAHYACISRMFNYIVALINYGQRENIYPLVCGMATEFAIQKES